MNNHIKAITGRNRKEKNKIESKEKTSSKLTTTAKIEAKKKKLRKGRKITTLGYKTELRKTCHIVIEVHSSPIVPCSSSWTSSGSAAEAVVSLTRFLFLFRQAFKAETLVSPPYLVMNDLRWVDSISVA
jgi:hypothetical protein